MVRDMRSGVEVRRGPITGLNLVGIDRVSTNYIGKDPPFYKHSQKVPEHKGQGFVWRIAWAHPSTYTKFRSKYSGTS